MPLNTVKALLNSVWTLIILGDEPQDTMFRIEYLRYFPPPSSKFNLAKIHRFSKQGKQVKSYLFLSSIILPLFSFHHRCHLITFPPIYFRRKSHTHHRFLFSPKAHNLLLYGKYQPASLHAGPRTEVFFTVAQKNYARKRSGSLSPPEK